MKTTLAFAVLCLGALAIHRIDVSGCIDPDPVLGCQTTDWGVDDVEVVHNDTVNDDGDDNKNAKPEPIGYKI